MPTLKDGAIASSIAPDSHNIVVIGDNDEDIFLAIKEVSRAGGGITIYSSGKVIQTLELPIAGLMSRLSMEAYPGLGKMISNVTVTFITYLILQMLR